MTLTLNPTLAAAQGSMSHKPIIKMLATQELESLPFDGEYFNSSSVSEKHTTLFSSTDGSNVGLFVRNGVNLVQVRTDTNRTFWNESVSSVNYGTIQNIAAVELASKNVGVVYTVGRALSRTVLGNESNVVSASAVIQTLTSPETPSDPAVVMLDDGSFLLTYIVYNSTALTYEIRKRTSADFLTWSAASTITLVGLLPTRKLTNLAMVNTDSKGLFLCFDYVDLEKDDGLTTVSNIYGTTSDNNGVSWSTPAAITNYSEYGTSCTNPSVSQRVTGELALAYTDEQKVLKANTDTLLWETDCEGYANATNLHYNPVTHRLYVYQTYAYVGDKAICGVIVIDTIDWGVIRTYTTQTSPGYNEIFKNEHVWFQKDRGDGQYAVFSTYTATKVVCVIDDESEIITEYAFNANDTYEIAQNVDIVWPYDGPYHDPSAATIRSTWTDSVAKRVYVCLGASYIYTRFVLIGYLDLTEELDAATGKYPFHIIHSSFRHFQEAQIMGLKQIIVVPERNIIIVMAASALPGNRSYPGMTTIIDLTNGEVIKEFTLATHQTYPQGGVHHGCYYEGHLYGSFDYTTLDDQDNNRGMVNINIDTEEITYHQPTWATLDDYRLIQKTPTGDGRILVAVCAYNGGATPGGVGIFDIASGAWTFHSKETLTGFEPTGDAATCYSVAYDAETKQIMVGSIFEPLTSSFIGVRMFDEDGSYNMGKLIEGINSDGWVWSEPEDLTQGRAEVDQAITIDPDNVLWSTWTHLDETEYSTKWDRDIKEKTLVDYLVGSVTLNWSIDKTGTLSFTVSHGHLFDPNNLYSTWSEFLKKGKRIEISLGERVEGVDYWQSQGSYIIDSLRVDYVRGQYPVMQVGCVSKDKMWGDMNVPATDRSDTDDPEGMLTSYLMDIAGFEAGMIAIPSFPNSHEIHYQGVDVNFKTIVDEILDHFQCVPYFDMDGKFAPKVVSLDGPVTNSYVGSEIIRFTPDDNYSSYTNRVTVNGEGDYFLQVTYSEELMDTIHGTGGWWDSDTKIVKVYYSKDHNRVCYDPRLVVLTSIKDFKILWSESGGDEFISFVDPDNRYCEVSIKFPGIMDVLIAGVLLLISVGTAAAFCTVTCGPYIFALCVIVGGLCYILGQVASYNYEVYAKVTGEEKQTVSAQADDEDFQKMIGDLVITETLEDHFCYTVEQCKDVAEHELAIVKAQRSRASFEKITHLQDEICDKIQIKHPYSQALLDIFITDIQRVYTKPTGASTDNGGLIDSISGWKL